VFKIILILLFCHLLDLTGGKIAATKVICGAPPYKIAATKVICGAPPYTAKLLQPQ
jgi:hypothetical protein